MTSKYAELGRLTTCYRCADSIQSYPDDQGAEIDLDVRDAPIELVPEDLRWRITGNGIAVPLGWTSPTDTVRVPHDAVCPDSHRPGPLPLRTFMGTPRAVSDGHQAVFRAVIEHSGEKLRKPTQEDVRSLRCPHCEADATFPCVDASGTARQANHKERVTAFNQARYESVHIPRVANRTSRLLQPARDLVRTVACPKCSTPEGQLCTDEKGKPRTANHMERVDLYTGDT